MPNELLLKTIGINALVITISFLLVWIWQLKSKNAGVVDALWGYSFPIQAMIYFYFTGNYSFKNTIILILLSIWGIRLGTYLAFRNIGKPEDKRYMQIRLESGKRANSKILSFYFIQVFLAILLFLPALYIFKNQNSSFSILEIITLLIMTTSILLEALADEQLRSFKSKSNNKGQICNNGLWYYSRHPNYFFEWMVWVCIALLTFELPWGFVSSLSPIIMYLVLTKGTGIELTEATILETKKEKYLEYIKSTSAFFPWKKNA